MTAQPFIFKNCRPLLKTYKVDVRQNQSFPFQTMGEKHSQHKTRVEGEGNMARPKKDDKKNGLQRTKETSVPQDGGRDPLQCHLKMTE